MPVEVEAEPSLVTVEVKVEVVMAVGEPEADSAGKR